MQHLRKYRQFSQLSAHFCSTYLPRLSPWTQYQYTLCITSHINPALGSLAPHKITPLHVQELHSALGATPTLANRCLSVISRIYTWVAEISESHKSSDPNYNPAKKIPRYKERPRETYLTDQQIARLFQTLCPSKYDPYICAGIKLLLTTGCRVNEIRTLEWSNVSLTARYFILTHTKNNDKRRVYINDAAHAVFLSVFDPNNKYVVRGQRPDTYRHDFNNIWRKIRSDAGLDGVRLHDLRHSFASIAANDGASLLTIKDLLGHRSYQSTLRYSHLADETLKQASQNVGRSIQLLSGEKHD